jgi:hypothetical protein
VGVGVEKGGSGEGTRGEKAEGRGLGGGDTEIMKLRNCRTEKGDKGRINCGTDTRRRDNQGGVENGGGVTIERRRGLQMIFRKEVKLKVR